MFKKKWLDESESKVWFLIITCLWQSRKVIAVYVVFTTLYSGIKPAQAWIAREMAGFFETAEGSKIISIVQKLGGTLSNSSTKTYSSDSLVLDNFVTIVFDWFAEAIQIPAFYILTELVILLSLMKLFFFVAVYAFHLISVIVTTRTEIYLQNHYLETLSSNKSTINMQNISTHVLYGSNLAGQCIANLYSGPYTVLVKIVSIILWQASLSAEWLPILMVGMLVALVFVVYSSYFVRETGQRILDARQAVMGTVSSGDSAYREKQQQEFYVWEIKQKFFSMLINTVRSWVMWISMIAVTFIAYVFDMDILPTSFRITDLAVVMVNISLISDPLSRASRAIINWQKTYPALLNTVKSDMDMLAK